MTRFNALATVAKLLPLLLLVVVGVFMMRPEHLQVTAAPTGSGVARASLLLIFAFLGVESALVPSGEVREPARTVPRAIFLAMGAVALLYVSLQVVAQGLLGPALVGDPTPLASAAAVAMGPAGRTLILVGSVVSMFGYVSGMSLAVPRMLFAFGRDGFFPARLSAVHPAWRTPHVAIAVQAVIVVALALFGNFEVLALAANVTILLVYAACCLAAVELRRRGVRGGGTPFEVPGTRVAPWLALGVIGWLLWELTRAEWLAAAVIVLAAVLVYAITIPSRRARAVATVTDALLRFRDEFPILATTTYLVSNSLGAMPRAVPARLAEYAEQWATRGVRAWAEGWWAMPVSVGDEIAPLIGAGAGEVAMVPNVSIAQAQVFSALDYHAGARHDRDDRAWTSPRCATCTTSWRRGSARGSWWCRATTAIGVDEDRLIAAIDERTRLVAISHVLFRSAYVMDVARVGRACACAWGRSCRSTRTTRWACCRWTWRRSAPTSSPGGVLKWLCGGPGGCFLWVRPSVSATHRARADGLAGARASLRLRARDEVRRRRVALAERARR